MGSEMCIRDRHRAALQFVLDELSAQLSQYICKDATHTRVSVYSVENDEFVLLCRTSSNPTLERRGRPSYPLNKGAIGQAWANVWAIVNSEETEREEWEVSLTNAGFTPEEAAGLTMHARSILAHRLDRGTTKLGVVVFESEQFELFDAADLKKVRGSRLYQALTEVVRASHAHLPRVKQRQEELEGQAPTVVMPEPVWKSAKTSTSRSDLTMTGIVPVSDEPSTPERGLD